ncbi:MAG TPA: hypothetical protein VFU11_04695 [Solirubrobacterales bacterium]|nr:hypothetical protein [Solirubrobacterales bacterium]
MALQLNSFPIDQPVMPEERQIGRLPSIESLETRLALPAHQWLIGERRIGKTSVAKAALARLRKNGSVAIDVDLSKLEISTTPAFAGEIARQAQAGRAGDAAAVAGRVLGFARKQTGRAKELSSTLNQLGYEDAGEALKAVSAVLAGADDGAPGLDRILGAVALHARATERRAYVLLDEIHLLANLDQAQEGVARWCREAESPLVFIFAGSEESAAQALREGRQPLASIGEEFQLAEIAKEDWMPGLRSRFAEAEVTIADDELEAILAASDCHPRRTMLVASRVRASAAGEPDRTATPTVVELAIKTAEGDRSWR